VVRDSDTLPETEPSSEEEEILSVIWKSKFHCGVQNIGSNSKPQYFFMFHFNIVLQSVSTWSKYPYLEPYPLDIGVNETGARK
jgi:hypothetical protein